MEAEPFSVELGEFLYPQGYARYRPLSFSLDDAVILVGVVDGLSGTLLEELLAELPKEFQELTQCICRDIWSCVKHLSVPMDDVWIRLGRGQELAATSLREHFLSDDTILMVMLCVSGRVDVPVLESSLSSASRISSMLRQSSTLLQKRLHRPSHFALGLAHAQLLRGTQLKLPDKEFFHSLRYATLSRDAESYIFPHQGNTPYHHGRGSTGVTTFARPSLHVLVHMDEIRSYLAPPTSSHGGGGPHGNAPVARPSFHATGSGGGAASPHRAAPAVRVPPPPLEAQAPPPAPTPPSVTYRPLTQHRVDDYGSCSGGDGGGGGATQQFHDRRVFRPTRMSVEYTPFRGAQAPIQAAVMEQPVITTPNASYLSSASASDEDDLLHVTRGGGHYQAQQQPRSVARDEARWVGSSLKRIVPAPTILPRTSPHDSWAARQASLPT